MAGVLVCRAPGCRQSREVLRADAFPAGWRVVATVSLCAPDGSESPPLIAVRSYYLCPKHSRASGEGR
jgi:hypothetical protein